MNLLWMTGSESFVATYRATARETEISEGSDAGLRRGDVQHVSTYLHPRPQHWGRREQLAEVLLHHLWGQKGQK
jgi:hypothetical protein